MKNTLTTKEIICTIILFLLGINIVGDYKLFSNINPSFLLISLIILFVFMFIEYIFLKKFDDGFYNTIKNKINKPFSKIVGVLFIVFITLLIPFYLKYLLLFIKTNFLLKTYIWIPCVVLLALLYFNLKNGIVSIGKLATFLFISNIVIIFISSVFAYKLFELNNMFTFFQNMNINNSNLIKNISSAFIFPFGDIVLLLLFSDKIRDKRKAKKIFVLSFVITIILIGIIITKNLLILGYPLIKLINYPSYTATGLISIGNFLARFEAIIGFNLFTAIFIKLGIYFYCAESSFKEIYNFKYIRYEIILYYILILVLTLLLPNSIMKLMLYFNYVKYYLIVFTIFIIATAIYCIFKEKNKYRQNKKKNMWYEY